MMWKVPKEVITKTDIGDYGGGFANYMPPKGREGMVVIAIDTNVTEPGGRLYIYANGTWHYVDLTSSGGQVILK